MADPRLSRLANVLVNYSLEVQKGETVAIEANANSFPLALETSRAVLRAGGHPFLTWRDSAFTEVFLQEANAEQLAYIHEPIRHIYEQYDCRIALLAESNTRNLSNVPAEKEVQWRNASRSLMQTFMQRSAKNDARWVLTLVPTQAYAQDADMSLNEFEEFVYSACHVDKEDPIAEWQNISRQQQKFVDYLVGKKKVRVVGPHADLSLSIADRTFINSDGRRNMPCGEIFTGPVEQSVNGWVKFTFPAIYGGREVEGVTLNFEEGKVVKATAAKNEQFLQKILDTDAGARYLGEFAIGTNHNIQRFTRSILFDEKIGGTIHMALGASYPETGGKNQSAIHWDMICDMRDGGQIFVDDELFYENGHFLVN